MDEHPITLRDLVDARTDLDTFLLFHEGELSPSVEAMLKANVEATAEKVESIAWYVKTEKAKLAGIDAMIDDLKRRKRSIEERCTWLTGTYLREQMHRLGIMVGGSLRGTLSTVRLQLNNPRLEGPEPRERDLVEWKLDAVKHKYVRYHPERFELDRVALLADAKLDPSILPEGMAVVRDESVRLA